MLGCHASWRDELASNGQGIWISATPYITAFAAKPDPPVGLRSLVTVCCRAELLQ